MADLVGREAEFSTLAAALKGARRGNSQLVEIVAPAGLGKSRLLLDFARHCTEHGNACAYVRAIPGDRDLAWCYAAEVVRQLSVLPGALGVSPAAAATLTGLDPSLSGRWADVGRDTSTGDDALRHRVAALDELIRTVSEEQPLALLLDDLHWADAASRDAIDRALARLHSVSVLVVIACRAGTGAGLTNELLVIRLEALGANDVEAFLASLGELPAEPWTSDIGERLRSTTDGSPLLILETIRLALDAGCLTLDDGRWHCPKPADLQQLLVDGSALSRRIARLDDSELRALLLLAVAGSPLSVETVTAGFRPDVADFTDSMARLERRGFVVRSAAGCSVAHDAIAESAVQRATEQELSLAHELLGRVFTSNPTQPDFRRAARHFAAAGVHDELAAIVKRWVQKARTSGDTRHVQQIVAELLASHAEDPRVLQVVRALPWRLRLRRGRSLATIGFAAALLSAAGLFALRPLVPDEPDVMVGTWKSEGGRWRMYKRQLTRSDIARGSIEIASLTKSDIVAPDRVKGAVRPGASSTFATTLSYSDAGGEEAVLATGPAVSRVTTQTGDDVVGDWSPDGRYLVIQTDRWSIKGLSDLAIVKPDSGGAVVTHLTNSPTARDLWPLWSPDGTRIAFLRVEYARTPNEEWAICVASFDGAVERCLRIAGYSAFYPIGWGSAVELIGTFTDSIGIARVLSVDTESGEHRVLAEGSNAQFQSHVPEWITCVCRRSKAEPFQPLVMSVERPELAVALEPGNPPPSLTLFASHPNTTYLNRLQISGATKALPADGEYQLRLEGYDVQGRRLQPLEVRWTSRDTTVAVVSQRGVVRPRKPGRLVIWATADGWRSDSAFVTIVPAKSETLVEERWTEDYEKRWALFGIPTPIVTRDGGQNVLVPNGDSTFTSGVYLWRAVPARAGVGLEVDFSSPINNRSWQLINVKVVASELAHFSGWDHRTGHLPLGDDLWQSCSILYPYNARHDLLEFLAGASRAVPVPVNTSNGEWVRARVQVLEDGRCGLAVNGRAISIIDRQIPLGDSVYVIIHAYSHRTRIRIGSVAVWSGVRRDVDWQSVAGVRAIP